MIEWLGILLGIEGLQSVSDLDFYFAAPWASERPVLLIFGLVCFAIGAFYFYNKLDPLKDRRKQLALIAMRFGMLSMLLVMIAEPVLELITVRHPKPMLLLMVDGSASMSTADHYTAEQRAEMEDRFDKPIFEAGSKELSRETLLKTSFMDEQADWINKLSEEYRLRFYLMKDKDELLSLQRNEDGSEAVDQERIVGQLSAEGELTPIGNALGDLSRRYREQEVAAIMMFSDFDQNTGKPAVPIAQGFAKPIYTVGLGPSEITDLQVKMQIPKLLKKDERAGISVDLSQSGLNGQQVEVELLGRYFDETDSTTERELMPLMPSKFITLQQTHQQVYMPFTPEKTGRMELVARVKPLEDELIETNNDDAREVNIRDDSLKILFVEYQPTWEWRFIKEVFYRDPLVGKDGFRSFLRSADFKVRRENPIYLPSLIMSRAEFFEYDVIFIGDVPGSALPEHFQQLLDEYVSQFGGGVVYVTGPQFGPQALANTKLSQMLPVVVDPTQRRVDRDFRLQLTPQAKQVPFMQLGANARENKEAWENIGKLQWYQPVLRAHPLATVLAEHPRDRIDQQSAQPIIAMRRYGKGEVVYFGINEMWRLRRLYGEKYYRQLWGQVIYRLGLGRALGSQKRFVISTDREIYRSGDRVRLTVEAYDKNYQPLEDKQLEASRVNPAKSGEGHGFIVPIARGRTIYETTFPVFEQGEHIVRVNDPITNEAREVKFKVAATTVEQRSVLRDVTLQQALANETGGQALEIDQLAGVHEMLPKPTLTEVKNRRLPLSQTWLMLLLVIGLMLGEWFLRKWMHMR